MQQNQVHLTQLDILSKLLNNEKLLEEFETEAIATAEAVNRMVKEAGNKSSKDHLLQAFGQIMLDVMAAEQILGTQNPSELWFALSRYYQKVQITISEVRMAQNLVNLFRLRDLL